MVDRADSREIATRAKELYEARWRAELERDQLPEFAARELESVLISRGVTEPAAAFAPDLSVARHETAAMTERLSAQATANVLEVEEEIELFEQVQPADPPGSGEPRCGSNRNPAAGTRKPPQL